MAQLRYECSHCTKLSCNHAAATQHNRDAHGGQANILPERSKAQMRVNDFAQRAEIARLRADLANARAVMVETCAREVDAAAEERREQAQKLRDNPSGRTEWDRLLLERLRVAAQAYDIVASHIRALSNLSPIAAAAGLLIPVFEEKHRAHMTAKGRNPADYSSSYSRTAQDLRALAEQEKADD